MIRTLFTLAKSSSSLEACHPSRATSNTESSAYLIAQATPNSLYEKSFSSGSLKGLMRH
jgi:hypothetical protein